ncbi:MAG: tyrosine--tRNA ligase [Candidatus Micrarchaeia archaeon]
MDIGTKLELVKRPPTVEVLTDEELRQLFETNPHPKHYIGFEISGRVHLGTGLLTSLKIQDLLVAGAKPTIFLADYHAWINGKLGGDLEAIQKVAKGYFKSAFVSLGLGEDKVRYVLASELYDSDYWRLVLRTAKDATINRMRRCITIMGRRELEAQEAATILYPAMQAADVFALDVDIAHAGLDQRKVHVLARELAERWKRKKPVALHTALLMGLQGPRKMGFDEREDVDVAVSSKMSKSRPETCIYVHDSEADIAAKIGRAWCPEKVVENNPVIQLCEFVLMRDEGLRVERDRKFGGDIEFEDIHALKLAYSEGALHPLDLKKAAAKKLAKLLEPSRKHFAKHAELIRQVLEAEGKAG